MSGELPEMRQRLLFDEVEEPQDSSGLSREGFCYEQGDRQRLYVGDEPLERFLQANGYAWVLRLAEALDRQDWTPLMQPYKGVGRKPLHPRIVVGLVVYGFLHGHQSLRELERLACLDVGAWWICGGIKPDHSTIGKFIDTYDEELTESFFVQVTQEIVHRLGLSSSVVAMDGTVMESAGSHWRVIRAEAAQARAEELEARVASGDRDRSAQAATMRRAADESQARLASRKSKAGSPEAVGISPSEPEAVVQPQKDKSRKPSYKPSVTVERSGLIVGQGVDPSSETSQVKPMLAQHRAIFGALPTTSLLDAGYHSLEVLQLAVHWEMDILCPPGRVDRDDTWHRQSHTGRFAKSEFRYDADHDAYECPAGQWLVWESRGRDRHGRLLDRYRGHQCQGCQLRSRCTQDKKGRTITRYEGEFYKEAMDEVLAQPRARKQYKQRQWVVEPVFGHLRRKQGLQRFHRQGTRKVRVEFALHCLAYNFKKADGLLLAAVLTMRARPCACPQQEVDEGPIIGFALIWLPFR